MTSKTFFPERFNLPFADNIHGKIFEKVDNASNKVAIAAPRGWGKTSCVGLGLMSRYILYRLTDFIIYISHSHDAASLQTENTRRELVTNRNIKAFFGDFKQREVKGNEFDETFSKKAWVAYDTLVWPRGARQQVRGVIFKNSRPGLIIIDDLEDPKEIENEDIRKANYQWLYADVLKAVARIGPEARNYKIVYIDTLKHEDSVLQKLMDSPEWDSIRLEACDDNFKSTAPNFVSDEDIQKEWNEHVKSGQTDVFFRELRNLPISTKDATFRTDYFRYYNLPFGEKGSPHDIKLTDAEVQLDRSIETVVILDPAKTVKIHSAESAIVGIGVDLHNNRLFIRDVISDKMYPDEIYDALFDMAIRLGAKVIGAEETSLNEFIKQPIKNEMFRRGTFFELVWLKPRGGESKEGRIASLVPYYRGPKINGVYTPGNGAIFHNASCMTMNKEKALTMNLLEGQLTMFPRSRLWDIMDCEAYIVQMLELGERYFSPSDEDQENPEAEFEALEYEKPIEDWRTI